MKEKDYENRIVSFIDTLGFRSIIEDTIVDRSLQKQKVTKLYDIFDWNIDELSEFNEANFFSTCWC